MRLSMSFAFCWKAMLPMPARHHGASSQTINPSSSQQIEHQPVLLIVPQADKVRAHLVNELHLFAHQVVAHCGGDCGVVRMTLGAAQEDPLAIST